VLILGIDPSTKTGWALYDSDKEEIVDYGCIKVKNAQYESLRELGEKFYAMLYLVKGKKWLDAVAFEVPQRGMPTDKSQDRIIGRFQAITEHMFDIAVIEVTPQHAKIALTGRGNADKGEMIAAAVQSYGVPKPDDFQYVKEAVADAIGVALAGFELAQKEGR